MVKMDMSYDEMKQYYDQYFGVSWLNIDIEERLAVIGLICNITEKARMKSPNATCYQIIMKIMKDSKMPENFQRFAKGLSIMCEDAMRNVSKFSDFGLKSNKEIIAKIKSILETYLPF